MKSFLRPVFIISFFLAVLVTAPAVAQCPMCKANVESTMRDDARKQSGLGLNNGIMFLLAMPYAVAVVVGVLWYKNSRFKKVKRFKID